MEKLRNSFVKAGVACVMFVTCIACEKTIVDENNAAPQTPAGQGELTIQTRTTSSSQEVSYPVTIYVMNSEESCVQKLVLASADDALSMTLDAGDYHVYAIAGATDADYVLPDAAEATTATAIALRNSAAHADLMAADNAIRLGDDETNTLTLTMLRKVFLLKDISLTDIPDDVEAVEVSFFPLAADMLLDGSYSQTGVEQTFALTRQDDGTTWKCASEVYLLPAIGTATVKVSMTSGGVKTSYSYTCSEALEANHEVRISGAYVASAGIQMTGTITGAEWGAPININFTFGEDGTQTTTDPVTPQDEPGVEPGSAPAAEAVYKECFVLSVADDDTGDYQIVTLLHKRAVAIDGSAYEGNEAGLQAAIDAALPDFDIEGITGWRLPTQAEMTGFGFGVFNSRFQNDEEAVPHDTKWYFFLDGTAIKSYSGSTFNGWYYEGQMLRPVTTVRFHK